MEIAVHPSSDNNETKLPSEKRIVSLEAIIKSDASVRQFAQANK